MLSIKNKKRYKEVTTCGIQLINKVYQKEGYVQRKTTIKTEYIERKNMINTECKNENEQNQTQDEYKERT